MIESSSFQLRLHLHPRGLARGTDAAYSSARLSNASTLLAASQAVAGALRAAADFAECIGTAA